MLYTSAHSSRLHGGYHKDQNCLVLLNRLVQIKHCIRNILLLLLLCSNKDVAGIIDFHNCVTQGNQEKIKKIKIKYIYRYINYLISKN